MTKSCTGHNGASLLPYLQEGSGAYLSFSPSSQGEGRQGSCHPFSLLDDSAQYSRLVEACFVSDAGTPLKKVLLQVEKDRYGAGTETLRPVANPDLDAAWQQAFASRRDDPRQMYLSCQTDAQGRLVRQAALFYCAERGRFFHPLCPSCGLLLTLCTDDSLLGSRGLGSYSGSARRYLYCKNCCELGGDEIYLYEREAGDPVRIRDRWALIERFGEIEEIMDPGDRLPCVRCPERARCFGSGTLARSRIIPFSFYPFYLLICEAPSLPAAEFLPLISGACLEKSLDPLSSRGLSRPAGVRPQVGARGTLFVPEDHRFFLEVLFLKLSFLAEVLRLWLQGRQAPRLERLWVHLAPLGENLPYLWNFSVLMVGDVAPKAVSLSGRRFGSEELAHLGLVWFQTLLQNPGVGAARVLHAVADDLALCADQGEAPGERLGGLAVPEHLCWNHGVTPLAPQWLPFWEASLAAGYRILDAAALNAPPLSGEELLETVNTQLNGIKGALFAAPSAAPKQPAPVRQPEPDHDLLCSVVAKVTAACRVELQAAAPLRPEPDPDEEATLILSTAAVSASPKGADGGGERYRGGSGWDDEAVTETVVLFSPQAKPGPPPSGEGDDDLLAETCIISPRAYPAHPPAGAPLRGTAQREQAPPEIEEADRLGETVVIAPRPRPNPYDR